MRCPIASGSGISARARASWSRSSSPRSAGRAGAASSSSSAPRTRSLTLLDPALTVSTCKRLAGIGSWAWVAGGAGGFARVPLRLPAPFPNIRRVVAYLARVGTVAQALVEHLLAQLGGLLAEAGHPVDHVVDQPEAVEVVEHDHVEGRRGRSLLLVAADM